MEKNTQSARASLAEQSGKLRGVMAQMEGANPIRKMALGQEMLVEAVALVAAICERVDELDAFLEDTRA